MASTFHFSIAAANLVKILSSFTAHPPSQFFLNTLTITDSPASSSASSDATGKRNSILISNGKRDSFIMTVDFQPLTLTPVEYSLTAGTQIPAPPDSPPATPTKTGLPPLEEELSDLENKNPDGTNARNANISTPDSKLSVPLSPLSANSNGSQRKQATGIRRYLSLRSLRGESRRHRGELSPTGSAPYTPRSKSRPNSPSTTDSPQSADASHSRKNASWFSSVSGRRKSQMIVIGRLDERIANEQPKGPPPPAIPEFSLGNELEMGGDDLFKNIK